MMESAISPLSILFLNLVCVFGYNVETSVVSPLYLRDGGVPELRGDASEAAYAGYSFDIKVENGVAKIFVGQPRSGHTNETVSHGGLYYCNFTYLGGADHATESPTTMTTVNRNATTTATPLPTTTTFHSTTTPTHESTSGEGSSSADTTTAVETTLQTTTAIPPVFSSPSCESVDVEEKGTGHTDVADALGLTIGRQPDGNDYAVCSSLRQIICPNNNNWAPGACYVGDPAENQWSLKKWEETACFDKQFEIVFVVDGSGSIGVADFRKVKNWLIKVTATLYESMGDYIRMEVLQYSDKDPAYKRIPLEDSELFEIPFYLTDAELSVEDMETKINNMPYLKSQTFTAYALKRVVRVEFQKSPWFENSEKIVVVLTDGRADDAMQLDEWYDEANALGITSFAVGVGNYNDYMWQLRMIANRDTSMDRVETVDSFDDLDNIISNLTKAIETTDTEGSSGSSNATGAGANDTSNAQLGASTSSSEDGALYIGAVGAYGWSGAVVKYDNSSAEVDFPSLSDVQSVLPNRSQESYLGYSLTTGYFDNSTTEMVAAGAPRYLLTGAVVIYKPVKNGPDFSSSMTLLGHPAQRQAGSYFGSCLLALDINGDGMDDLLIGAPLFVNKTYDEGRVFVYLTQKSSSIWQIWRNDSYRPVELKGAELPGGRFGTAIANAGDLNADGFKDFIVGAPLTDGGKGAVFIYHGSQTGPETEPAQIILASKLEGVTPMYFGQSLQGNIDLDDNKYPDIAVGAPKSDTIILLRSRPIVKLNATLEFTHHSVHIFECVEKKYTNCTSLKICFTATGTSVESYIGLEYNVTLDTGKTNLAEKRLEFRADPSTAASGVPSITKYVSVPRDEGACFYEIVNMKQRITDYDSDVTAVLNFDLQAEHLATPMSSVRDHLDQTTRTASTDFTKGCGHNESDDECIYDLHVDLELTLPQFILITSSGNELDLSENGQILVVDASTSATPTTAKVNLTNNGENAFATFVRVTYSSQISLSVIGKRSSFPPTNSCIVEEGVPYDYSDGLKAQIYRYNGVPNVMRPNNWCYFEFNVITTSLKNGGTFDTLTINVTAYTGTATTSSSEKEASDNTKQISRHIKYRSDFTLRKKSVNSEVTFNYTTGAENITSVTEIGRNTSDIAIEFEVKGAGYSNIPESRMTLKWPWMSKGLEELPLLYLYQLECSALSTHGEKATRCSCDSSKTNPYNLALEAANENTTTDPVIVTVNPANYTIKESILDCNSDSAATHFCESVTCDVTNLAASDKIIFKAMFRVWTPSLKYNTSALSGISFVSRFSVSTAASPLIISNEGGNPTVKTGEVITRAKKYSTPETYEEEDNLWIYILSAVGAFLLLIAIVVTLWKVGFFKSKYADMKKGAEDDPEDDPDGDTDTAAIPNVYENDVKEE